LGRAKAPRPAVEIFLKASRSPDDLRQEADAALGGIVLAGSLMGVLTGTFLHEEIAMFSPPICDPVILVIFLTSISTANDAAAPEPERILYAVNYVKDWENEQGKARFKILVMNEDGSKIRRLTKDEKASEFDAVFSPDGKRIAFAAVTDRNEDFPETAIFVMNADGSDRKQISKPAQTIVTPAWSPDGKRIAYGVVRPPDEKNDSRKAQIFVMDADGENVKELGEGAFPTWSPDGKQIAYSLLNKKGGALRIRPADGGEAKKLGEKGDGMMPVFSPDGKRIAYVGLPTNKEGLEHPGPQVFVMNADGSDAKQVTKVKLAAMGVRWSADGKRLYYCQLGIGPRGMAYMYSIDPDGKNSRRFAPWGEMNLLPGVSVFARNLGGGNVD
jgi:Tol biopolymer transport system component